MASAARLGSRVDAGLLAGCVVMSLIAIALHKEDQEAIASALRRTVVAPLVSLQRGAERWRTAWASTDRQQLLVDSLAMRAVKANALVVENDHSGSCSALARGSNGASFRRKLYTAPRRVRRS